MSEHDDFCEAEYVSAAGGHTACSCGYRRTRGLVAEHDRQVAERAWDEGYEAGDIDGRWTEVTMNPHRKEKDERADSADRNRRG